MGSVASAESASAGETILHKGQTHVSVSFYFFFFLRFEI
jgi:hypothetical protein